MGVWLAQTYLVPSVMRWWRGGPAEPSPADKAAAAVASAIQAQVCSLFCAMQAQSAACWAELGAMVQTAEMRSTMEGMKAMLAAAEAAKATQPEAVSLPDLREELRGLVSALNE